MILRYGPRRQRWQAVQFFVVIVTVISGFVAFLVGDVPAVVVVSAFIVVDGDSSGSGGGGTMVSCRNLMSGSLVSTRLLLVLQPATTISTVIYVIVLVVAKVVDRGTGVVVAVAVAFLHRHLLAE
jgi:hypothetical protein